MPPQGDGLVTRASLPHFESSLLEFVSFGSKRSELSASFTECDFLHVARAQRRRRPSCFITQFYITAKAHLRKRHRTKRLHVRRFCS